MIKKTLMYGALSFLAIMGMAIADTVSGNSESLAGCEITNSMQNGMIKLESYFLDDDAGTGRYRIAVQTIGGSNNINSKQSGRFKKKAGETVHLGTAQLSAYGQIYNVELDVTFNGQEYKCSKKITPSI